MVEPVLEHGAWTLRGYTSEREAPIYLKEALKHAGIDARDSIELLPSAALGEKRFGLANVSVSNNRYEPRQAAEMATQMTMGMPVEILKKQGGYFLVRTPDGYISWTEDMMVATKTREELSAWNKGPRLVFTDFFGHALADADSHAPIVSDLVSGNILRKTGEKKGFYRIEFPDGRQGYIPASSAQPWEKWINSRNPNVQPVEHTARTMMGTPYLWGGTSLKGVDCSGFIKTAYFLQGLIIPRDASQQAGIGEKVDIFDHDTVSMAKALENLRQGDLLFFSALKDGKSTGRVTHVAMYIGDGRFIHASGLVRINSMRKGDPDYSDWETRAFVGARRLAGGRATQDMVKVSEHPLYVR
jgi:cell wall-associated NlpC family hydrolase